MYIVSRFAFSAYAYILNEFTLIAVIFVRLIIRFNYLAIFSFCGVHVYVVCVDNNMQHSGLIGRKLFQGAPMGWQSKTSRMSG